MSCTCILGRERCWVVSVPKPSSSIFFGTGMLSRPVELNFLECELNLLLDAVAVPAQVGSGGLCATRMQ